MCNFAVSNIFVMRKIFVSILAVVLAAAHIPCSGASRGDRAIKRMLRPILDTMSVRSKVAQLFFLDVRPESDSIRQAKDDSIIVREQVGGIILMEGNIEQTALTCNRLQRQMKIPLAVSVDGEFGVGMRVAEFKRYPRQGSLAKLPSDSLVYEMGRQIAQDMHSLRIDINFAPVVDVNLHPDVNTIKDRSFGPDKKLVADYGSAFMRGMQDAGVVACAKHFPGHGDTEVDSHKALPVLNFPMERIDSVELYPFRKLIKDGVDMVMVGHLHVPALDSKPASVSKPIITGLLRKKMRFKGIITTDALNMKGVLEPFDGSYERATLAAYEAGSDILLMPRHVSEGIDMIVDYIGNDRKKLKDLDTRVLRILSLKARCGKLSHEGLDIIPAEVDPSATEKLINRIENSLDQSR